MKLDPRIEKLSDIITCFDEDKDRAKNYAGQTGYFSDDLMEFNDLESCIYGELKIIDDDNYPFNCNGDAIDHALFIPESVLKPKPKKKSKYIPFKTIDDLRDYKIHIGDVIQIRPKDTQDIQYSTIVTNIAFEHNTEELIDIALGVYTYSFATLCDHYLFLLDNEWVPFGKRVEE